jgi:hypothetical protein
MNDTAKLQLAVFEDFVAQELEYLEDEGLADEGSDVLDLLQQAAMDASMGKVLDAAQIEQFGFDYYNATAGDFYGDTDMSDAIEAALMETLATA